MKIKDKASDYKIFTIKWKHITDLPTTTLAHKNNDAEKMRIEIANGCEEKQIVTYCRKSYQVISYWTEYTPSSGDENPCQKCEDNQAQTITFEEFFISVKEILDENEGPIDLDTTKARRLTLRSIKKTGKRRCLCYKCSIAEAKKESAKEEITFY